MPRLFLVFGEIVWSRLLMQVRILNDQQCRSRPGGSGSALFAGAGHIQVQQGQGKSLYRLKQQQQQQQKCLLV